MVGGLTIRIGDALRMTSMQERSQKNWRTDPELRRTRTIVLDEGTPESKRSEILRYFDATFDIDETLLEVLKYDETFFVSVHNYFYA